MNFPHLQGREKLLEPLGFTGHEAEWITLVCLHSGLFTRDQVEAFFGLTKSAANRFILRLLQVRRGRWSLAEEVVTDGRRVCRVFGKSLYRALDITNVRHRREASIEVVRRRLLSLDFVLDHPDLPWLATEQEKVDCFEQLGIDPDLLPKRIYSGRAHGSIRYFHIKMPIAVGQDRAVFTYIDPGMATPTEMHSWGAAHQELWQRLREGGRRIELVAVAWEQHLLDRAERVLRSWAGAGMSEAEREIAILRRAIADADWTTVEHHGGLDAALKKINQFDQEPAVSNGNGLIDYFRLWGSHRCRRMDAPPRN